MEDRSVCICPLISQDNLPHICYLGLFDGHEGSHLSQILANQLQYKIKKSLENSIKNSNITLEDIVFKIKSCIYSINQDFLVFAKNFNLDVGSTCVVGLLIDSKVLIIANIGNSRAIVCKKTKNCVDLSEKASSIVLFNTVDHTPDIESERRRIEKTGSTVKKHKGGIYRIDEGLELSRSLGDISYIEKGVIAKPDIHTLTVNDDFGFVILGSDGIFDKLSNDLVCIFAENSKHKCEHFQKWISPEIERPIALPGETVKVETNLCDYPRLGLPFGDNTMEAIFVPDTLHGLDNCEDCFNEKEYCKTLSEYHSAYPLSFLEETDESRAAANIVKEAYNRRSTDNLAVSLFDISSIKKTQNEHKSEGIISRNEFLKFGTVIRSDKSNTEYELVEQLRKIPSPKQQMVHVSLDTDNALQIYQYKSMDNESSSLFLTDKPYSLSSPAPSIQMCIPQYHHRTSHSALIQAIQSVPLLQANEVPNKNIHEQHPLESLNFGAERLLDFYSQYKLEKRFASGSFGEIWRSVRRYDDGTIESGYILKRLMIERGDHVLMSGLRERYFGLIMGKNQKEKKLNKQGYNHIVRFVESFGIGKELWLVFRDEGVSLHSIIYTHRDLSNEEGGIQIVSTSDEWLSIRKSSDGNDIIREILKQLLTAVSILHKDNIVHRDIKPDNILMNRLEGNLAFNLRLIDFGSAIDPISIERYYGSEGPSDAEQTEDYAPPEALFHKIKFDSSDVSNYCSYDMWSIGIVWLELIMGTPNVFGLSDRTMALLSQKLDFFRLSESERNRAFLLRGMMELCIYPPKNRDKEPNMVEFSDEGIVNWKCTEKTVMNVIKSKDPLKKGLPNVHAVHLLLKLLEWNPEYRITAEEALKSPFFMETT